MDRTTTRGCPICGKPSKFDPNENSYTCGEHGRLLVAPGFEAAARPTSSPDPFDESDLAALAAREAVVILPPPSGNGRPVAPNLVRWLRANARPQFADELVSGVNARTDFGIGKYKRPLCTLDGRPARIEVWQELLDALQYGHKGEMEGEEIGTPLLVETVRLLQIKLCPRRPWVELLTVMVPLLVILLFGFCLGRAL